MITFEQQLKKCCKKMRRRFPKPDIQWRRASRRGMVSFISDHPSPSRDTHLQQPSRLMFSKPTAVIASVFVVVLLVGGGTGLAAQNASPGDTLYLVKRATEDVALVILVSPQAKARLHMKYADRRLNEFENLYAHSTDSDEWKKYAAEQLDAQMRRANVLLGELHDSPDYADIALRFEEVVRSHEERMKDLEQRLNTTTIIIINRAQEENTAHHKQAIEALMHAQKTLKDVERRHELIQQRLNERLQLLQKRLEQQRQILDHDTPPSSLLKPLVPERTPQSPSKDGTLEGAVLGEQHEEVSVPFQQNPLSDYRGEGVASDTDTTIVDSETIIEGSDYKNVDETQNVNNGQVIHNTRINVTGEDIRIRQEQYIRATSRQSFTIDGVKKMR